jgi:hypothetical protein
MHLLYENIASYMFSHWTGTFFPKESNQNNGDYILNKTIWTEIGTEMHSVRKTIPTYLGRPSRNILLHHNGYKVEEWAAWITLYSLPLLKNRLPEKHYKGWANFVKAVRLCQKFILSRKDIDDI